MTRLRAAFAIFAAVVLWGGPAAGWPTEYFLQQEPGTQNAYVAGLIDMYEHARDDDGFAADPGDWLLPCIRPLRPSEVRAEFVRLAARRSGVVAVESGHAVPRCDARLLRRPVAT